MFLVLSIGKGFAGAMKRHNFAGLRAYSRRVSIVTVHMVRLDSVKSQAKFLKVRKMAGHMGAARHYAKS